MRLSEARAVLGSLFEVVLTNVDVDVRARLVNFLTAASRGPWWTQLKPNPEQPTWGTQVVHVLYRPKRGSAPGIFAVQPNPGRDTVPMRVGAGVGDINRIADELLA